jgi:hypothetical protein
MTTEPVNHYSMPRIEPEKNENLPKPTQTYYPVSIAKGITHANQRWTPEEETELKEAFTQGLTIGQLAKKHQRTRGAIQARLAQMGLVDNFYSFFMRKKPH